jgi:sugar phosphate isomerase/epimerase
MKHHLAPQTRRDFLKRTMALSLAAGGAASAMKTAFGAAKEERSGFKYSICNEMFGDWPFERAFAMIAECGYRGVEIAPYTINEYVTRISAARRAEVRRLAERNGLQVVGLHWLLAKTKGFHLTTADAEVRRRTAVYLGELARFCADLGGRIMVLGSPVQRNLEPGMSLEQAMQNAAETLRLAMPACEKAGAIIALEPLAPIDTNFMTTAAEGAKLVGLVDSPCCRLHLDCRAMATESIPIPELLHRYRKLLVHFHANDPNRQGPGFGKLDFVPIMQALADIHYRGWVSVEVFDYSPGPERLARESIGYLRKCAAERRSP